MQMIENVEILNHNFRHRLEIVLEKNLLKWNIQTNFIRIFHI